MRGTYGWHAVALLVYLLAFLISPVQAATPTSFCKCTCFKKSMIIPLDAPNNAGSSGSSNARRYDMMLTQSRRSALPNPFAAADDGDDNNKDDGQEKPPAYKPKTCSDCNKSFCLDLGLPDCKDATDENVQTSCFQRDSGKDEAVVFIFIIATVSLLGWALAKPFIGRWMEQAKDRRAYLPVSGSQER